MATPVADLVRAHCERTGDTLQDIADRASLSRQTMSALVNRTDKNQLPRASTIRKLATGLDLPYEVVRSAFTETAYGDAPAASPHTPQVEVLIAYAERLPKEDVDVLLAAAQALGLRHPPSPDDDAPKATRQDSNGRKSSRKGLTAVR